MGLENELNNHFVYVRFVPGHSAEDMPAYLKRLKELVKENGGMLELDSALSSLQKDKEGQSQSTKIDPKLECLGLTPEYLEQLKRTDHVKYDGSSRETIVEYAKFLLPDLPAAEVLDRLIATYQGPETHYTAASIAAGQLDEKPVRNTLGMYAWRPYDLLLEHWEGQDQHGRPVEVSEGQVLEAERVGFVNHSEHGKIQKGTIHTFYSPTEHLVGLVDSHD